MYIYLWVCVRAHMLSYKCVEARKQFCHVSLFALFEMGLLLATVKGWLVVTPASPDSSVSNSMDEY